MEAQAIPLVYELIQQYKPRTYCEIGVHNGLSAAGIIKEMFKYQMSVKFVGYDAFEPVGKAEHNGKSDAGEQHYIKCCQRMQGIQKVNNLDWQLIKGFTTDTLKPQRFDFAYIDGGHSYETVNHDYSMLKRSNIILFDDYNLREVKCAVDEIVLGYQLPYTTPNGKKKKWVIINEN